MTTHHTPRALAILALSAVALTGCQAGDLNDQSLSDWLGAAASDAPAEAASGSGTIDTTAVSAQLEQITIAEETDADYDRDRDYGQGWDTLPTGCDVRDTVLARDMTEVVFADDDCTVTSGVLKDPYTGRSIDFTYGPEPGQSDAVQLDHLVPLNEAHDSGAATWPQQRREAFAQDMANLIAVDGPTNNSKGADDAGQWLPPNEAFWCSYVAGQVQIKHTYDLSMDAAEADQITEILTHC